MAASALTSGSYRQRIGLQAAHCYLNWLYAQYRDADVWALDFWKCFSNLTEKQAEGEAAQSLRGLMEDTRDWDFLAIQDDLRKPTEALLTHYTEKRKPVLKNVPYGFTKFPGPGGRQYLAWGPVLAEGYSRKQFVAFFLNELMSDLGGVADEAIGRCRECQRLFIRLRAGRGFYCSQGCLWKARAAR
jgi:hypothetical protein